MESLLRHKISQQKFRPPLVFAFSQFQTRTSSTTYFNASRHRTYVIQNHISDIEGLPRTKLEDPRESTMEGWAERGSYFERCEFWPRGGPDWSSGRDDCLHIFFLEKSAGGESVSVPESFHIDIDTTSTPEVEEEPSPFTDQATGELPPRVRTPITYTGRRRRNRRRRVPASFDEFTPRRDPDPLNTTSVVPSDLTELMNSSSPNSAITESRVASPDVLTGEPASHAWSDAFHSTTSSDSKLLWFGFEMIPTGYRSSLQWSISTRSNVVKELHKLAQTELNSNGGWANTIRHFKPIVDEPGVQNGAIQNMLTYYFEQMASSSLFEEGDQDLKLPRRWLESSQLQQLYNFGQLLAVACCNDNYPMGFHPLTLAIGFLQNSFTQSDTEYLPALLKLYDSELGNCFANKLEDFLNYNPLRRDHYIETYSLRSILDQEETKLSADNWELYQTSAIWRILFGHREWAMKQIQMGFRQAMGFQPAKYRVTFDQLLQSWKLINGDISMQLLSRLVFRQDKYTTMPRLQISTKRLTELTHMFLFCLGSFSTEQLKQFLVFVTGTVFGNKPIEILFYARLSIDLNQNWPKSSMCTQTLHIRSNYKSVEDMKHELTQCLVWTTLCPEVHNP